MAKQMSSNTYPQMTTCMGYIYVIYIYIYIERERENLRQRYVSRRHRYVSLRHRYLSRRHSCANSRVQNPQKLSRMGSPWLRLSSNSARMNPTASRNLFKPLPALREPIFGPKSQNISIYCIFMATSGHDPLGAPFRF